MDLDRPLHCLDQFIAGGATTFQLPFQVRQPVRDRLGFHGIERHSNVHRGQTTAGTEFANIMFAVKGGVHGQCATVHEASQGFELDDALCGAQFGLNFFDVMPCETCPVDGQHSAGVQCPDGIEWQGSIAPAAITFRSTLRRCCCPRVGAGQGQ